MTDSKPKVLVTGASGLLGGLTVKHLKDKYDFSALNRSKTADFAHTKTADMDDSIPWTQADIADLDAIMPAFEGIDMVVHMANYTGDADSWDDHLNAGIIGTRNVYEAARLNGVKRVVLGSTGDTMTGYECDPPYGYMASGNYDKVQWGWSMVDSTWPTRPVSIYGACKVFCEALGHHYSDIADMSVLVIRLGAVLEPDAPSLRRHYSGWLGQKDYVSMVEKCLAAPMSLRYDIFDAISNNKYKWRNTSHATEVLGWVPQQSVDDHEIDDKGGWHQVKTFHGEK
ncbi:MAG: NAD(P)-dependent oxidoreductase [SAR202 cluster bacterium]|jgi:nucleoside-diphosphate-sugar epimerase|nr:NAD(P)-dependent oxidoreductase [SAR202 cluster bacterium]